MTVFRDNLLMSAAETSQHKHHFAVKNLFRGAVTAFLVLTALALAGCMSPGAGTVPSQSPLSPSSASGPPSIVPPTRTQPVTQSPRPAPSSSIVPVHDPGQVTGTITGPCHTRDNGLLPDPRCTPGSYDPAVTQANLATTLCVRHVSSTGTVTYNLSAAWKAGRPPTDQTSHVKFAIVDPAYGITASGELDHLDAREIGGSNDLKNLWTETGSIPNHKDAVEKATHKAVCTGTMSLRAAQIAMAANWILLGQQLGVK